MVILIAGISSYVGVRKVLKKSRPFDIFRGSSAGTDSNLHFRRKTQRCDHRELMSHSMKTTISLLKTGNQDDSPCLVCLFCSPDQLRAEVCEACSADAGCLLRKCLRGNSKKPKAG